MADLHPVTAPRPFLQVWFTCSGQYQKVFRNASGTSYQARCAKCGKCARFRVAPGGSSQRMFKVSCE
ncbi:MAG: hypothetical protein KDA28_13880 [Phycisphaerales bacterium]|nr:hypothetical protein [Phycisphaerales bacterium]